MPSKLSHEDYWKRRNDDINRWLDEQEIMVTQRLNAFYEQAKANTEKQLYEFYGKYAEDNKITRQDAEKKLKGVDLDTYRENAERYRKWADRSPASIVKLWRKELDLQYKASQATRMDALLMDVRHEMAILSGDMEITAGGHLERVAVHAYENAFIAPTSTLNRPAIKSLVNRPFNGYNYSEDLWGNTANLASKLEATFAKGFVQGLSVQKMAQEVRKDFNVQRANAETIIRTDGNHIVNNATLQRYEDAGLKGARIHVHIDDRTTEICKQHDRENKLYTLEEADGVLPAHYNCRSTFIPDRDELMEEHWVDELEVDPLDAEGKWHDKIKAKIKQMMDNDTPITLDTVLKIGKTASEAFTKEAFDDAHNERLKVLKKIEDQRDAVYDKFVNEDYKDEAEARQLQAEYNKLSEQRIKTIKDMDGYRFEYISKELAKVRDVGGKANNFTKWSSKPVRERITHMSEYLPKDWAEHLSSEPLYVKKTARGYFREKVQPWDVKFNSIKDVPRSMYDYVFDEIAISGTGSSGDYTIIHELMHVMEYRKPEIIDLERQFYEKRTDGEALQRMRDITGLNYGAHEVTRVDDFLNPYIGRDYKGRAYELLSMGVENLYSGRINLDDDAEYRDFVLGVLLSQ